jgi:monoamine oxidase
VILAIPPMLTGAIDYRPQLPILRAQLTQRYPMGYAVKVHATYCKPFWRHLTTRYPDTPNGLSAIVLSKNGPVTLGFDNSPRGAKATTGVLLGFVFANTAGSGAPSPRRSGEWTRGYIGYPTTEVWLDYQKAFTSPIGRVFLAGGEAGTEDYGGMESALGAAGAPSRRRRAEAVDQLGGRKLAPAARRIASCASSMFSSGVASLLI